MFNSDFFKFHLFENFSERCLKEEKNVKEKRGSNGINEFSIELKKKRNTSKLYYYHQRKLSANPNSNCVKEINKSKITLAPRLPTNRDFLPSFRTSANNSLQTRSEFEKRRREKSIKESNVVEQNRNPVKLRSKYSSTNSLCSKPGLTK